MTNTTKQPDKKSMSDKSVSPIVAADALPMPWVDALPSRAPDGATLHLVRLSAVVRWLMASKRLPFVMAVDELHKALVGVDGLQLYFADESGSARALVTSDTFGYGTVMRSGNRGIYQPRQAVERYPFPDGVTGGVSAALYTIRHLWGGMGAAESTMNKVHFHAQLLAITCKQAAKLWGVGEVVNAFQVADRADRFTVSDAFNALYESRKGCNGEAWFDHEKNIIWAEICLHPNRMPGLREHLAKLLGLNSAEALSKLVRGKKRPIKTANVIRVIDGKKQA